MRYVKIPQTDLAPSAICLGSADLGSTVSRETTFAMLDLFRDQGGAMIDTAALYANWLPVERSISEKTIGAWLKSRGGRDKLVLATKGAHPDMATLQTPRMSRADIEDDLNQSLVNLGVETIDLYYLHRDARAHPVEEIMDVLRDQVRAGKVRYVGCSNWKVDRIGAARDYAAAQGWAGFVADQPLWNLAVVDPANTGDSTLVVMDDALWGYHREQNLAAIPYTSQASGLFQYLARGAFNQMRPQHQLMYASPENQHRLERLQQLGAETGMSITQLALGYLMSQPFPTIPIVGCRSVEQLSDSLTAADVQLSAAQVRYLERGE